MFLWLVRQDMTDLKQLQSELSRFRAEARKQSEPLQSKSDSGLVRFLPTFLKRRKSPDKDEEARKPLIEGGASLSEDDESRPPDCSFSDIASDEESLVESEAGSQPWTVADVSIFALKLSIYVIGQIIAIITQFGAVFFTIAMLVLICTNLNDRRRRRGEMSAYSVFNPKCKPIHGTVTAEKLAGELTFGALHY